MSLLSTIYNEILFKPLFNALVFLTSVVPFADLGVAVVILTVIVRFVIFPFTHKSIKTQAKMREIEPELKKIRSETNGKQEEQARRTMELYKRHGVSPFSGCLLLLIQLPILIALYQLFIKDISASLSLLYPFVSPPEGIRFMFLGLVDMTKSSIPMAVIAALSQYFQMRLAMPSKTIEQKAESRSFQNDFQKMFSQQAAYIFPVIILIISLKFPAAVALYWTTSNIFASVHEYIVKRKSQVQQNDRGPEAKSSKHSAIHP
ncbi:MAG: YidC/Oxa1 family membrane protein insertase [Patescibacteria group bacterium]